MTSKKRAKILTLFVAPIAALSMMAGSAIADDKALAMRAAEPLVYATPLSNMVILEFTLYDNKTWCRLYIQKEAWELAKANGGELPVEIDPGQLECERR